MKSISIRSAFLSFKEITHEYQVNILITHNENQIPLVNLHIIYISVGLAPQVLSAKSEWTLLFSNVLIIGLCKSTANSLFEIFSFLVSLPQVFFIKKYIDYWRKSALISIIFRIFSNIRCFITQYFFSGCSSSCCLSDAVLLENLH